MQFLTDFADQAVVLPLAAAAALVFAWSRWWRGLRAWLIAVGGVLGAILLLKIAFEACTAAATATGIDSPSGHTASACIVYGGIALLLLRDRVPALLLALVPAAIAAVFAATRLALQVHTPGDVIVGGVIGMIGIGVLARLAGPMSAGQKRALVVASVVVLLLHGSHLPAEQAIRRFAQQLQQLSWWDSAVGCRAG